MIEVRNLRKDFYGHGVKQNVLKGVNLKINNGDFITIEGPSGGGKSTLLQIIGLLTEPTEGDVIYNDVKVDFKKEKTLDEYRRNNIGLVFQNPNLIGSLSPLENLIINMNSNESYNEKINRGKELLNKVGLKEKFNSKISSLSGGEAQRVAIVRALVNKPKVVLCDEPTGSLDSSNGKNIIKLLLEMREETGCAIVVITHDKEIAALGNKRLYLKDGELNELSSTI